MITDIHIFSPGTQTSAQGVTREFTKNDLKQIVDSYDPQTHEAPIRIGHEDSDKVPAWGWVKGVKMQGGDLFAEVEFAPQMEQYVKDGLYKKVSASFYSPESKINPEPGKWSLRHVAMLGAQPPAVKGLKGFAYSEDSPEGVLDFAAEMALNLEAIADEDLGPTLKTDISPLEMLKEKIEEARSDMAKADLDKKELEKETLETEEQKTEAEAQGQEPAFAEDDKKPAKKGQGKEDSEEEIDDDEDVEDDDDMDLKEKKKNHYKEDDAKHEESDEAQHMDPTFEPAKKKRGSDNLNASDVGVKPTAEYEESESEDFAANCLTDGKERDCKAPPAKGMSGMPDETPEGEGPVASKVKKNPKSGECDESCEDQKYEEEDSIEHKSGCGKKRNYMEDEKGKYYMEGDKKHYVEHDDEKHEESDEETHGELTPPKHGDDGMKGRPSEDGRNDAQGRNQVGKAGVEGETGRNSKSAKSSEQPAGRKKTGKSGPDPFGRKKTAKHAPADRKKVGKPEPAKAHTGRDGGPGNEYAEQFAEMAARLEQLENANRQLVQEKQAAERAAHRSQLEEFAEALYSSGKLTPAIIESDDLVNYMEGLEYGTLEFAEGENAATKLMEILANLPQQVSYAEVAAGATPDEVDFEEMDTHEQALHVAQTEGLSYADALKKVLF